MQRLHDKVSGNWQKITTMVYEINKSRDLKKRTGNHIWKKLFLIYDYDRKRISWYMHIIFLTKILGIFAVSLNPQPLIIQNWIKKNATHVVKCQTICWKVIAKSKVYMLKILSNH